MHKNLLMALLYAGLTCALIAFTVGSCGGKQGKMPTLPQAISPQASTPQTFDEIKAQLDSMRPPEEISAEVWAEVKHEFLSQLEANQAEGAKIASRAPTGKPNQVQWIYAYRLEDAEAEPQVEVTWRYRNAGDYDLDGAVSIADFTPLVQNLGKRVDEDARLEHIDTSGSGVVDIGDITAIATYYGTTCAGYRVFGSTSWDGPWEQVCYASLEEAEHTRGRITFRVASELIPGMCYYRVRPECRSGTFGEWSLPTRWGSQYPAPINMGTDVQGGTVEFSETHQNPDAFVRWEYKLGDVYKFEITPVLRLVFEETGTHYLTAIIYNGHYTYRRRYKVWIVAPITEPVRCEFLPTPQGPLLYWSREGVENAVKEVIVMRDGESYKALASDDESGRPFYYLDYKAETSSHTYEIRGMSDDVTVYFSEPLLAHGSLYDEEHLFLLAEPKDYRDETSAKILTVIVNNAHRLWFFPSLRIYIEGQGEMMTTSLSELSLALKSTCAYWPPSHLDIALPVIQWNGELGDFLEFCTRPGRLNWAHHALPTPSTVPLGRTTIIDPFEVYFSDGGASVTLLPYLNTGKAFTFYIDAYRNMHAPENCHSLTLYPYEVGPAEPVEELSGRLSLGKLPLPGDYSGNGCVGIEDISPLAMNLYKPVNESNSHIDQNDDGEITIIEIIYIASYYGDTLDDW